MPVRCLTFSNTHPHNLSPRFSPLPFSVLSQLYRCLMFCPWEWMEHLSFSGDGCWWWKGVSPTLFLQLEGCQSTETRALAPGRQQAPTISLPSPPDLSRFHVSQHQAAFPVGILSLVCSPKHAVDEKKEDVFGGNGRGETMTSPIAEAFFPPNIFWG